jgi:hypothetical protein
MRQFIVWLTVAALFGGAAVLPTRAEAQPAPKSSQLAQIKFIKRGLSVQPPHKKSSAGKLKEKLYTAYSLQTQARQLASIGFKDSTVLHMNQRTSIQLKSTSLTYVQKGEVDEALTPGSNHRVQTPAAVASAIGTNFDVKMVHGGTIFLVLHGVIQVKNKQGTVTVKPGQESVVLNGQTPQPPTKVDVSKVMNWTADMPTPNLPENVALDAAGASVIAYSSQYTSKIEGKFWQAKYINDGRLDYGWESDSGNVTDQSVTIALPGGKTYNISEFVIDPAATHMDTPSADMKDFTILASTSGTDATSFTPVYNGVCQQSATLQKFMLQQPIKAKYIELIAHDNYGSPDWIGVAELEVVGTPA